MKEKIYIYNFLYPVNLVKKSMRFLILVSIFFIKISVADSDTDSRAIGHAPIGVSADHYHKKGESMISIRHGYMNMSGNIFNGSSITNTEILMMPNPLSNMPANLSVIPKDMSMQMSMIGAMYAPSDNITLMAMGMFVSKDMNLNTYQAMMNRNFLGSFNTSTKGISDLSLGVLYRIREEENSRLHGEITFQHSIGEDDMKDIVLTPMDTNTEMILPYGMQISDKSSKIVVGFTYLRDINSKFKWGNQVRRKFSVAKKDWAFGNQTELNTWVQYEVSQLLSLSTRIQWTQQSKISGSDTNISAPVQTANTENYGGKDTYIGFGINYLAHLLPGKKDRLALEFLTPINQNKNNLQMKAKSQVMLGYQKSF